MATIPIVVPITQDVIDHAQIRNSSHCMIADAIRAALPDASHVSVDLQTIRFTNRKRGRRYVYLTPPTAQRALINFDQGLPAEPMELRLRKPAQVIKSKTVAHAQKNADGSTRRGRSGNVTPARQGPKRVDSRGTVIGGKAPPNAVLSNNTGRVRAYGLGQLKP